MKKSDTGRKGTAARAVAASPAVAGYRPLALAAAVAAVFGVVPQVRAQPTGTQAIHGTVTQQQQGNTTTLWTTNGAGTSHSVLNHTGFSVPAGTVTNIVQPSAASMSINRVVGNNPSQIFGTLSSNGKVVLVNPAGIAVGAGAVVDTAGFTASTLRMSDADALAGRLVFGDGTGGGALSVSGKILARSGDVVLISPDVRVGSEALVQAPNGATIVAAGQKVALTGRGLEGIQLELQAGDQALNLGRLEGDAVGIFAGQLKHSGAIQATAVSVEGGKVVLKGGHSAEISGTVTASKGTVGGQVHATANQVMLKSGAIIDVSGRQGGGEALIGGGWQGQDSRIQNAQATTIEAGATIKADARHNGDGGTIVAWSDGATAVAGHLSARGGAEGGNGGRIETSGKHLAMSATIDVAAPKGRAGSLLLDPTDLCIATSLAAASTCMGGSTDTISAPPFSASSTGSNPSFIDSDTLLGYVVIGNVTVQTTNASGTGNGDITWVDNQVASWTNSYELRLLAERHIAVNGNINTANGTLHLQAGSGGSGSITQTAPVNVATLIARAPNGSVTLTNTGNTAAQLAGTAGTGGFSYVGTGNTAIEKPYSAIVSSYIDGIQAGSNSINVSVGSGGQLSKVSTVTMAGGSITLEADTMSFGGAGTITATNIALTPKTTGRAIEIGSASLPSRLQLDTTSMQAVSASGTFRIGSTTSGQLHIGGAVSPVANVFSLKSGSSITQAGGATISASNLSVEALGNIYLSQANSVNNFAARVGNGANPNRDVKFVNAGTFTVANNLDGLSGVSVQNVSGSFNSAAPDGVISLTALGTGTLLQAGGALLAGKGVYAEGGQVVLLDNNVTGVIAGKTTGALSGGVFRYKSINGISVSRVDGFDGISQNNPAPGVVELQGTSVAQESGKTINASTLHLTASTGGIFLDDSNNTVGTLRASAAGNLYFTTNSNLTLDTMSSSSGAIRAIAAAGYLQTTQNVSAGNGIELKAMGGSGESTTVSNVLNAGSGGVKLYSLTGSVLFSGTSEIAGSASSQFEAPSGSVAINAGLLTLKTSVSSTDTFHVNGGTLAAGANVSLPNLYLGSAGVISGSSDLGVSSSFNWDGGSLSGSGSFIVANGATADINVPGYSSRPIINNGLMRIGGSGSIGVSSGFALLNNGIFEILNDNGIVGGTGTITNAGVFRKTAAAPAPAAIVAEPVAPAPPAASVINVGSFVNNGTLEVKHNALQFTPGVFTTNSGSIVLANNAVLDNGGSNLTNAGALKGTGYLNLGSSATLTNTGTIAPGGPGAIGALGIQAGTINVQPGSVLQLDVTDATLYDRIFVTGNVNFASGVTVTPTYDTAAATGSTFDFLRSTTGTVAGTAPTGSRVSVALLASPAVARGTVTAPVGTTATGERIADVLPTASTALINAVLSEQDNTLTTFVDLLEKEEQQQADGTKARDSVINETSCKP